MGKVPVFRLSEEIARFAFEIHLRLKAKDWYICFTNPTAGPWKKINFKLNKKTFEFARYLREETRPDLILFNKRLKSIIIIEAKDSFLGISTAGQVEKSFKVFNKEKTRFLGSQYLPDGLKKDLTFINSFLWADENLSNFDKMKEVIGSLGFDSDPTFSIIVNKSDGGLEHFGAITFEGKTVDNKKLESIFESLNLRNV